MHLEGGRYYDRESRAGGEQGRDNIIRRDYFCVLALHSELASTPQTSASKMATTEVGEETRRGWKVYTKQELAVLVVNIGERYVRNPERWTQLLEGYIPVTQELPQGCVLEGKYSGSTRAHTLGYPSNYSGGTLGVPGCIL